MRKLFLIVIILLVSPVIGSSFTYAQCTCPGPTTNLFDSAGFLWDITSTGSICNGTIDAYDVGMALRVDGIYFPIGAQVTELAGRQVVTGPNLMSGLNVTRRVYVPAGDDWARFLEYFQNPTGSDITVTVRIETNPGSDGSTVVTDTFSGDTSYTVNDHWLATDDFSNGGGDPSLNHNFWGAGGSISPVSVGLFVFGCASNNGPFAEFSLTVPANSTRIIMHFGGQNANRAAASANAAFIDGLPPSTLFGISSQDQGRIVNWFPLVCANANGLTWCYNNQACGQPCNDVCAAGGLQPVADNTVWFEAQNSQAECEAITTAFGLGTAAFFSNFQFGCLQDSLGSHTVGGGLVTNVTCSSDPSCPNNHRTGMDTQGVPCGPSSRRSVCPCEVLPQPTIEITKVNKSGNKLIKNRHNRITITGVTPNKKAWLFWGFKMGNFKISGGNCDGTELKIRPKDLLAKLRANSSGKVSSKFYVPSSSENRAKFQALDYASCSVSPVFEVILLAD